MDCRCIPLVLSVVARYKQGVDSRSCHRALRRRGILPAARLTGNRHLKGAAGRELASYSKFIFSSFPPPFSPTLVDRVSRVKSLNQPAMNIHFFFPLLVSFSPTLALPSPQEAPPPPAPSSSSTPGITYTVKVGGGGPGKLYFDPQVVMASPGDVLKFDFGGLNHTVTESSFEKPCTALSGGVDASATTLEVPVKDATASRWFYCKAGEGFHCGAGMYVSNISLFV